MASRAITAELSTPVSRRRRRGSGEEAANVRYFLLKPGSTIETPELGEELTSINQALVRAFKSNEPFLTLTAWNAVEDTSDDSGRSPTIVKQIVNRV